MPTPSLDLDHATMQRIGRRVADLVAQNLTTLSDRPTKKFMTREATVRHTSPQSNTTDTSCEQVIPLHVSTIKV